MIHSHHLGYAFRYYIIHPLYRISVPSGNSALNVMAPSMHMYGITNIAEMNPLKKLISPQLS